MWEGVVYHLSWWLSPCGRGVVCWEEMPSRNALRSAPVCFASSSRWCRTKWPPEVFSSLKVRCLLWPACLLSASSVSDGQWPHPHLWHVEPPHCHPVHRQRGAVPACGTHLLQPPGPAQVQQQGDPQCPAGASHWSLRGLQLSLTGVGEAQTLGYTVGLGLFLYVKGSEHFWGKNNKNRFGECSLNLMLPVFCEALAGRLWIFWSAEHNQFSELFCCFPSRFTAVPYQQLPLVCFYRPLHTHWFLILDQFMYLVFLAHRLRW